jgi:hypothetical protein
MIVASLAVIRALPTSRLFGGEKFQFPAQIDVADARSQEILALRISARNNGAVNSSAPSSKSGWTSWNSLWYAILLLFLLFHFASHAMSENDEASMQRTSFGTITDCERSGRSGYFCKYVFPVDGEEYTGGDRVDSYRMFGQIVMVYYVSQEPSVNALEEFSQKSHRIAIMHTFFC